MNNKRLGMAFEKRIVNELSRAGYWVHFISPDCRGAQPFDIIYAKYGTAYVGDCKTSKDHVFRIGRLEENQKMAFEKWKACGNTDPVIFVEYNGEVKKVSYFELKKRGKVDLNEI